MRHTVEFLPTVLHGGTSETRFCCQVYDTLKVAQHRTNDNKTGPSDDGVPCIPSAKGRGLTARPDKLAGLTRDELRKIVIVPLGDRLEQGAKYIDLQHLERGEFVATADMVSDEDHYYVPKHHTDYMLWNRLKQLSNQARLNKSETPGV